MNKQSIVDQLIKHLENTLAMLVQTAVTAREAATGEESKAENKYDTRGLEAAYLAGAQAKRSEDLTVQIMKLKKIPIREFNEDSPIGISALVTVAINGDERKYFLILPFAGGTKISVDNDEFAVITPDSSVGSKLIGKTVGDIFGMKVKEKSLEYEIVDVC